MAVRIDSNTLTEDQLREEMRSIGLEFADEAIVNGQGKKPSEPSGESGEPAATTEVEAPATTEAAEPERQEVAPKGETEEEREAKKSKGGFQRKIETLTSRVDSLKDQLDEERGDKTRLKAKLEQAEAELEEMKAGGNKPSEEPADKGPAKPKRPKMPQLSDFEFDADKFAEAQKQYTADMDKYDDAMDVYFQAVAEHKANERVEAVRKADAAAAEEAKAIEIENEFVARKEDGKKNIPDFDEVLAQIPEKAVTYLDKNVIPGTTLSVAGAYIKYESEAPADLIHYFAQDYLDGESEGERLVNLSPTKQIIELRKIEEKLIAAREAKSKPKEEKKPPVAAAPPANPKPATRKTPDEPIDPVGARGGTSGTGVDLQKQLEAAAEAGNGPEVRRIRGLMQQQAAKARHAG